MIFEHEHVRDWEQWLADFRRTAYPVFEAQGLTFAEAVLFMQMNRVVNRFDDLEDALSSPDDGEDWKC